MPTRQTSAKSSELKNLGPVALAMVASRFKVLSDPSRLCLLHALMHGEQHVSQLVQKTGLSQANVSKHLSMLAEAGFIARRRDGMFIHYSVADDSVFALCDLMCGSIARKLGRDLKEIA